MTRFLIFALLCTSGSHASLLRKGLPQESRKLPYTVGCPQRKACKPPSAFASAALETASCDKPSDCWYGECVFVPSKATFMCSYHAQVPNVCELDCVDAAARSGSQEPTPPACPQNVKTCASLSSIEASSNNPNLVSSGTCTKTEDCGDGKECRYVKVSGQQDELRCDDDNETYCGYECITDDRASRSIALGDGGRDIALGGGAEPRASTEEEHTNAVFQCSGIRVCASLTIILESRTSDSNALMSSRECTKTEDCQGVGECRYANGKLVCDDDVGSYCDEDCVDDDRET